MRCLPEDVEMTIYKMKHEIEYRRVIEQINFWNKFIYIRLQKRWKYLT